MKTSFSALFLPLFLLLAAPSHAVIISTGNGTGNVTAPADNPGFANVGKRTTGLSVVYVGNGWVLTANHVGAGDVILAGQTYTLVAGSPYRLVNPDLSLADLLMFRVTPTPPLPTLTIASAVPTAPTTTTLIGNGANRGAFTFWSGITGYYWGTTNTIRWGTAPVVSSGPTLSIGDSTTHVFTTTFAAGATAYPAQGAVGDSGGAAFVKVSGAWVLAGVMVAIDSFVGQPASSAFYGNQTFAADLSYYRNEIVPLSSPAPGCGLGFELAFVLPPLLALRSRRDRSAG